jgi:hypothetical protein
MNRSQKQLDRTARTGAETTEIGRILATEEELVPSSGFLSAVMERVREEAAAPAPIPFPWKRAIPGILFAVAVLGWGAFELVRAALPAARAISLSSPHLSVAMARPLEDAGWVALALGVSLLSSLLSRRLAGWSGLL